ncbi:unnamed protein product [Caenorhabditis auriculariae]|uniref:CBS domain-containing protein n=1 Tax=Caenorhabditis auriculariae TaxID=2777116 RepID=A0A8S1GUE6_9PELO|nr:unnamed protein product [Caenorhabditis auriculariae]
MIETTKPINAYCTGSMDHGYESGTSDNNSRRNSFALKDFVRGRRFTMLSRPARPGNMDSLRKASCQVSPYHNDEEDNDDIETPAPMSRRRMSVPESGFQKAEYAILRPTRDMGSSYEIFTAFDRHTDPYRHYMQSLTCYDLQPTHGSVLLFYGNLKMRQAVTALSNNSHQAAVVWNADVPGDIGILTLTDCLTTLMMAHRGQRGVAEMTLNDYFKATSAKPLIRTTAETSVWDAARVLCLNRVRSLPVFDTDGSEGTAMYLISMRRILHKTVLKLADPSDSFAPYVRQTTLIQKKVGTWNDIGTLTSEATCKDAIEFFLEKKLSCVPIVNKSGQLQGIISKQDIIRELSRHHNNYLQVLTAPVINIIATKPRPVVGKPEMTVLEAIASLVSTERQALIIVDAQKKPVAVVSYCDIMEYIQNCESSHKNSVIANP